MTRKNSKSKKIISAGLAYLLLLNTACSGYLHNSTNTASGSGRSLFQNYLGELRGEVNTVEPDGYSHTRDDHGSEEIDFYYTSDEEGEADSPRYPTGLPKVYSEMNEGGELLDAQREYLAGHGERMAEVLAACRSVGCQGIEGLDENDPVLSEARQFVRADRSDIPAAKKEDLKTLADVQRELERIDNALSGDKAKLEKAKAATKEIEDKLIQEQKELAEKAEKAADDALKESQEQVENANSVRQELIQAHNTGVDRIQKIAGTQDEPASSDRSSSLKGGFKPSADELERFGRINESLRETAEIPELNDSADVLAEIAKQSAERGDLASYELRMNAARAFASASQHKGDYDRQTLTAATSMSRAAQSLENEGLISLANEAAETARKLLPFALGFARMNELIDLPFNVVEAFSGKTLDFDDQAKAFVRDCTTVERAFAVGALAMGTIAALSGSAPVFLMAIAAGSAGKVLKAFKNNAKGIQGVQEGEKLYEETVKIAKTLDRAAPGIMAQGTMTPYAKRHIWYGNIRVSNDKLKVRIDGGLHTQDGLRQYLELAPAHNAPVSREMLPNGVERVVFPDSALTNDQINKLRKASENGFGAPNGKTLFPAHWTPEKVEAAAEASTKNGKVVYKGDDGFRMEVVHDGVTVLVNYGKDGKPNSAFPKWIQ
jgi:uncharacterized membrane-anchored protein YhcB (DUF1043 family)